MREALGSAPAAAHARERSSAEATTASGRTGAGSARPRGTHASKAPAANASPIIATPSGEGASALWPLEAHGLTLEIDGRRLIDGVDLRIAPDAARGVLVVMGPNGAGKSLLLRLLHGLVEPTRGSVSWGALAPSEARARQAMVFQRPVLLRRTVGANLDFALRLRGRGAGRPERGALLAQVGLEGRDDTPARRLSGGEQQRLALARALATAPELLFLDEPTASLDPASTALIERVVTEELARGTGVIWVTHDIGQARRLAREVVFLANGRVAERTPATEFFARPRSEAGRAHLEGRIET